MRLDKLALLRSSARNQRWYAVSAAIHVAAIAGLILLFRPMQPTRTVSYIDLGPPEEAMPAYQGPGTGERTDSSRVTARVAERPVVQAPSVAAPAAEEPAAPVTVPPVIGAVDSVPTGTRRIIGPEYGDGRAWVRVGDAERGAVPARTAVDSVPTHIARVDSALAEKIRTFMDTVPPDSFATRDAPPWTTEIAGRTWGIDGKWIYLGGVKIPTAILALLPIPADLGGNYDAQQRAALLDRMRRDLMEAAQRASNAVEFRKYVKELRERKEVERQQRVPPEPRPADTTTTRKPEPLYP